MCVPKRKKETARQAAHKKQARVPLRAVPRNIEKLESELDYDNKCHYTRIIMVPSFESFRSKASRHFRGMGREGSPVILFVHVNTDN